MALRRNLRVMVVDDMSVSRQTLIQMLERLGVHRVVSASSGPEALDALSRYPTDLVISDLHMPAMDGVDLLARMRQGDRSATCQFVLTAEETESPRIVEGRRLGLDGLLRKPFEIDSVLQSVERAAGRI